MTTRTVDPLYVELAVTTPPATTIAAPLLTNIDLGHVMLLQLDLLIPRGHCGATGFALDLAQQPIFPWGTVRSWIVADDLKETFDIDVEVDRGLRVATYNTGHYAHTHYMRFKVSDTFPVALPAPVQLVAVKPLGAA